MDPSYSGSVVQEPSYSGSVVQEPSYATVEDSWSQGEEDRYSSHLRLSSLALLSPGPRSLVPAPGPAQQFSALHPTPAPQNAARFQSLPYMGAQPQVNIISNVFIF